jgi:hypothetical protein
MEALKLLRHKKQAGPRLPAYLSNGLVGVRVNENPLRAGMTLVSGFSGNRPFRHIEAAAVAPYPVAADIALGGVWMSDFPHRVRVQSQEYNIGAAEITTRLVFSVDGREAGIHVLTFCDRDQPTVVWQQISLRLDSSCDVNLRSIVDARGVAGRATRHSRDTRAKTRRLTVRSYGKALVASPPVASHISRSSKRRANSSERGAQ